MKSEENGNFKRNNILQLFFLQKKLSFTMTGRKFCTAGLQCNTLDAFVNAVFLVLLFFVLVIVQTYQ